jgi:hypothetical protein
VYGFQSTIRANRTKVVITLVGVAALSAMFVMRTDTNHSAEAQYYSTPTVGTGATTTATFVLHDNSGPASVWDYPSATSGPTVTVNPTHAAMTAPATPTP